MQVGSQCAVVAETYAGARVLASLGAVDEQRELASRGDCLLALDEPATASHFGNAALVGAYADLLMCPHGDHMKSVGVREFRDRATTYLSEPVAISKHGRVIGFYIPVERDENDVRRAVAQLDETVERVLKDTGIDEEELAGLIQV